MKFKSYTEWIFEKVNILKLKEFSELKENWNLNGARQFDSILIEKVINIISQLKTQPKIYPTGRESIQLEFEKNNGDYLEFEVFKDSVNALIIIDGEEIEKQIDLESVFTEVDNFKDGIIKCRKCSWKWDIVTGGEDMFICHKCGHDNHFKINKD